MKQQIAWADDFTGSENATHTLVLNRSDGEAIAIYGDLDRCGDILEKDDTVESVTICGLNLMVTRL